MGVLKRRSHTRREVLTKIVKESSCITPIYEESKRQVQDFSTKLKNYVERDTSVPFGVDPSHGELSGRRATRKRQQCASFAWNFESIIRKRTVVVEFGSGTGHLSLLLAWLYPEVKFVLLERKEFALQVALNRIRGSHLSNCELFCGEIDDLKAANRVFDVAIALHCCGCFTDEIIGFCVATLSDFLLCPCCYGQLTNCDQSFPKSNRFSYLKDRFNLITSGADYFCSQSKSADKSYDISKHCMSIIDIDRLGGIPDSYETSLRSLIPLQCSPKNNLLLAKRKAHTFEPSRYHSQLTQKVEEMQALFETYAITLPIPVVIESTPQNYRLR